MPILKKLLMVFALTSPSSVMAFNQFGVIIYDTNETNMIDVSYYASSVYVYNGFVDGSNIAYTEFNEDGEVASIEWGEQLDGNGRRNQLSYTPNEFSFEVTSESEYEVKVGSFEYYNGFADVQNGGDVDFTVFAFNHYLQVENGYAPEDLFATIFINDSSATSNISESFISSDGSRYTFSVEDMSSAVFDLYGVLTEVCPFGEGSNCEQRNEGLIEPNERAFRLELSRIVNTLGAGVYSSSVGNGDVASVPEPTTLSLLLGSLLMMTRLRKAKA